MPKADFLETYPLYRKFPMNIPEMLHHEIPKPSINMKCLNDECENLGS